MRSGVPFSLYLKDASARVPTTRLALSYAFGAQAVLANFASTSVWSR